MIDLHTHTLLSDGKLLPSELARRAEARGLRAVGMTDHCDASNLDFVVPRLVKLCRELNRHKGIRSVPGVEITHVPPAIMGEIADRARELGALLIVAHGETLIEPVEPGTNRAALEAGVHILAHPGLISREEVALARERGVYLEISGRPGHSFSNGHVVRLGRELGAALIFNSDAHAPEDLIERRHAHLLIQGSGLSEEESELVLKNSQILLDSLNVP